MYSLDCFDFRIPKTCHLNVFMYKKNTVSISAENDKLHPKKREGGGWCANSDKRPTGPRLSMSSNK